MMQAKPQEISFEIRTAHEHNVYLLIMDTIFIILNHIVI